MTKDQESFYASNFENSSVNEITYSNFLKLVKLALTDSTLSNLDNLIATLNK